MQKMLVLFGILIFLCSCAEEKKEMSDEARQEMVDILFDIHTAQVIVDRAGSLQRDSLDSVLWRQIEQIHSTTQADIRSRLKDLKSNPTLMKEILSEVEAKVDTIKNRVLRWINAQLIYLVVGEPTNALIIDQRIWQNEE